jgi:hypothetical protein
MTRETPASPRVRAPAGLAALALALLLPVAVSAQSIEEELELLGEDNGPLYTRPVSTGIGAGLNSGWFRSARARDPLRFEVSVRAVGTLVPDGEDSFQPILPDEVTVAELGGQTFRDPYGSGEGLTTPTATGEGDGIVVAPAGEFREALLLAGEDPAAFALEFPEGFDIPAVPVGVIQANLGVLPGVEVVGRFLPNIEIDDEVGSIDSFGGGLSLTVTEWLGPGVPVDVAVQGGLQTFDVGDYLSANSRFVSVMASRTFSVLTLFGAGTLEESDVEVEFDVQNPRLPEAGTTIRFDDQGENTARFTAGFQLDLLFLQLGADYSVSDYNVVTASLGVGI